jgi:tetratricopeptide (TPR) repeat protein
MNPMAMNRGRRVTLASLVALLAASAIMSWTLRSSRTPAALSLARASYERGEWRAALQQARTQLATSGDDREALRLMARASARLGRDVEAESLYSRLGVGGAEAEDFLLLGSTLFRRGQEAPGLRMLEKARDLAPDRSEVLQTLAEQYRRLGFSIASERAARALASHQGSNVLGSWMHAQSLMEIDRPADAAEAFQYVLDHDRNGQIVGTSAPGVRNQAARAWLRAGQPARARKVLEPLLAHGPDPEAAWLMSRVCLQEDDLEGAVRAFAVAGGFERDDRIRPEPAPWIGHSSCAQCHASIHKAQRASRHARTLTFGARLDSLPLPDLPIPDPGNSHVEHRIEAVGPASIRTTSVAPDRRLSALFDYAIGSGNRGWTPIVRDEVGSYWEYRLTRYAAPVGWDTTIHHPAVPESSSGYLGKPLLDDQVRDCLGCHTTNPDAVREARATPVEAAGIDCERCHGPAGNHLHAAKLGFPDPAVAQPRLATGRQRDTLCAQCHRAPRGFPDDVPDFIRFQSPTLARSRCFIESAGALDCITCHNPHRDAASEPAAYEGICLNCHGAHPGERSEKTPGPSRHRESKVQARSCPIDRSKGCVGCHMPHIPNVIPHTAYTDHFIRVHRD